MARTGMLQANAALRQHGLRAARLRSVPQLEGLGLRAYLAVPLRKGLKDADLKPDDVVADADTLSGLPDAVANTPHGRRTVRTTSEPQEPREPDGALKDVVPADKVEALKVLLAGSGISEEKVAEIVRRVAAGEIDKATARAQKDLGLALDAVDEKVRRAIEAAEGAVPITHEVKIIDKGSFRIDGCHPSFPTLCAELAQGFSVYLCGPAGSGKTTAVVHAAEKLGIPFFLVSSLDDVHAQVQGYYDTRGDYVQTQVYRWATTPGSLLLLDDCDRFDPRCMAALNAMIDNRIGLFACGQLEIDASNMVAATANTWGEADATYTAAQTQDAAALDRYHTRLFWDYDTGLEQRLAVARGGSVEDAQFCQRLRKSIRKRGIELIWSPRQTVAVCVRIAAGASREQALSLSALATLDPNTRQSLIDEAA